MTVIFVRSISAFSSLLLSYVALRILNPSDFGIFTFSISFVTFLSIFLRFGLDRYLLKIVLCKKYYDYPIQVFFKILATWFWLQLFLLPLSFLMIYQIPYFSIVEPFIFELLTMASCFSIVLVLADYLRAKISVSLGLFVSGIILPTATFIYIFLVSEPALKHIFNVYTITALITIFVIIAFILLSNNKNILYRVKIHIAWSELFNLFVNALCSVGMVHIPILILGLIGAPEDIALFQKCFLLSMVIGSLNLVLQSVYEPRFARAAGSVENISPNKVFDNSLKLSLSLIFFGSITAIVIFYNDIFIQFQPEDFWICICLCLGHCINLLASRYKCYFMMTRSSIIRNVSLSTLLVLCLTIIYFFYFYMVLGAAIAYLISVLFKFGIYNYHYRKIAI